MKLNPRKTTVQMSAPKRSPPPRTQAADPFPPLSRDNSKRSVSPPAYRAVSPPRMNSPLHSFHTFVGHSTLVVMPPPDMWAPIGITVHFKVFVALIMIKLKSRRTT